MKIKFKSLKLVLLMVIAICILPIGGQYTAKASGLISLSETKGVPGTVVEVQGSGFISEMLINIYFSSDKAQVGNAIDTQVKNYELIANAKTNSIGILDTTVFSIPSIMDDGISKKNVTNGQNYIYITYLGSKKIEVGMDFFILGSIKVTPDNGQIGSTINIDGTGLTKNEIVFIYFSSKEGIVGSTIGSDITVYQQVGTYPVQSNGTLGGVVSYQIPDRLTSGKYPEDVHGGDYYIYTAYSATRTKVATISRFTIPDGEISLNPINGNVGSQITISGKGLRPNQQLTIDYDGDLVEINKGDTSSDSSGQFICSILVPDSTTGSHKIIVSDVTGNHPDAWFTVKPSVSLQSNAQVGENIKISGYGFSDGQDIYLSIKGYLLNTNPLSLSTNRKGTFSGYFLVPVENGPVKVQITDALKQSVETEMTISPTSPDKANISISPDSSQVNPGYVGEKLTVEGKNFLPSASVSITYNNPTPSLFTGITTNAEGTFQFSFDIPAGPSGEHTISITDGSNTESTNFYLENTPPPPPVALIPEVVSGVKPTTNFSWSSVEDISEVTYTFQVASDSSFKQIAFEQTGLKTTGYSMKGNEKLEQKGRQTSYYWRVQAVDGAGNVSDWTTPLLFYVGSAKSAMPIWSIFLLAGLGLLIVIFVVLWLMRVRRAQAKNI
jgi:hypothetical protein